MALIEGVPPVTGALPVGAHQEAVVTGARDWAVRLTADSSEPVVPEVPLETPLPPATPLLPEERGTPHFDPTD